VLRTVTAIRYVAPLREGGSLPALVEADDDGLYVVKLRGAGQGPKALVAEVIAGVLARRLDLPVPEVVLVELDPQLPDAEPDPEIQDLLAASAGLNVGLDFLPGALPYTPGEEALVDPGLAACVVWLDALVENVDRTARNVNLLLWHRKLWLIDHGAALYRQHAGLDPAKGREPFAQIREHVLLGAAGSIAEADAELAPRVTRELLADVIGEVPGDWLGDASADDYVAYLAARLESPRAWVQEAEEARARS
jgi:HipA-like kinase